MAGNRRQLRLDALRERLTTLDPATSPLPVAVATLASIFEAGHAGAYSLERNGDRLRMSYFVDGLGNCGTFFPDFSALIDETIGPWSTYDPHRPQPRQRNTVVRRKPAALAALAARSPAVARVTARSPWLLREHHLRVLLCDGTEVLAWVGLLRARAFTVADERAFQAVLDALRDALVLHRQVVNSGLAAGALEAALEAVGGPAFLMRGREVVHANHAGRDLMARAPEALEQQLRSEIEGHGSGTMEVTRLPGQPAGGPDHYLLVARPARVDPDERVQRFAQRHGLSGRQVDVLRLVVRGEANKTIAATLECAESTVELHVTCILARTGCAGRAALVARFWSERAA